MASQKYHHEQGHSLHFTFTYDIDDVVLEDTPQGLRVQVEGHGTTAEPGGPALPVRVVQIAVPPGMWPDGLQVEEGKRRTLTRKPVIVVAAQRLQPGVRRGEKGPQVPEPESPDQDVSSVRGYCVCQDCDCCRRHDEGGPDEDRGYVAEPFPHPEPVPPDPDLYEAVARDREAVAVRRVDQVGPTPVLTLELRPVRYNADGLLELVTRIEVEIRYQQRPTGGADPEEINAVVRKTGLDLDPAKFRPMPEVTFTSRAQLERHTALLQGLVLNPDVAVDLGEFLRPILDAQPADYLIITDNMRWNAATITPTGPVSGNPVAEFQRLASHKRSRGVTAKVVTITDVVDGRYGDFRGGARDLQEVIRRFLKDVHERWGVAWVLLGGDVSVLPMRWVAGGREGTMDVDTADPPADNKSFWTGTFLKMHVVSPGTWWPGGTMAQLVNDATGALIPFDSTGSSATSGTGWYFTTNNSYSTRSATATAFVRVNGPASVVNGTLRWLYQWNMIPTDLYYASLQGWVIAYQEFGFGFGSISVPYVLDPDHDWDVMDNGIYGQFPSDSNVDGVAWATDVSVGRAPVESGTEAKRFVDKVINYETYGQLFTRLGADNSDDWVRRVVIAADNWGGSVRISSTTSNPPGDDRFHAAGNATIIHLKDVPTTVQQLIAHVSDSDRRELPYNESSSPSSRGWHYATSSTDHGVNGVDVTIWGAHFFIPLPGHWIVVHGPAAELNPIRFELDCPDQDTSMVDQEQLREQLAADLPAWNRVRRLYADLTDLTPAQRAAAPVAYLTTTRLQNELNASPHIVSLSGHGSPDGCCGAEAWMAAGLTTSGPGFIAYADSCLTGASDSEDSMGEALVKSEHGAVAYIGNTRFSWISMGDDVQRWFFHQLTTTRHLGLLNDVKLRLITAGFYPGDARWGAMSLTLYGDPEMRVWRQPPSRVWPRVKWDRWDFRVPIEVYVPKPPIPDPPPYVIHARQDGGFERTVRVEAGATARLDVADATSGELFLTVAIDADGDHLPFERTFTIDRPEWVNGLVTAVSHRHEGQPWTQVTLAADDGSTTCTVAADEPDHDLIVEAAVDAQVTQTAMGLYLEKTPEGARVTRFRI